MSDDAPDPTFLGFGAFETTAFVTAVLVACYSLISNPTGRQRATDQAEYQVYAGWRLALLTIILQVTLMLVVVIQLVIEQPDVPDNAKVWLILLMVTPWAPLAGPVRDTLTSGARVQRMMRSRLTRNELSATIRDRFKFGQRAISIPTVLHHMHKVQQQQQHPNSSSLTTVVLEALNEYPLLACHEKLLAEEAMEAARTEEKASLALGNLWVVNQGPQPTSIARWRLKSWSVTARVDLLARAWTTHTVKLRADCMRNVPKVTERARVLDVIDTLQQGGTVSDDLVERSLAGRFCERCRLSSRAAVESFLESSERGHSDMRANVWVRDINMDWRGPFERIIDAMWEAAFIENAGSKVDYSEDKSDSFGNRGKVTTLKMMALLFLIARSIMHTEEEAKKYETVAHFVDQGPFVKAWWSRYWSRLLERIKDKGGIQNGKIPEGYIDTRIAGEFKATLRDIIDEDFANIVDWFVANPIEDSICSLEECRLRGAKLLLKRCT